MDDYMSPRGREETVTLEEIIRVARGLDGPFFGAAEIAEHIEIGPERVRHRLNELVEKGILDYKQVGSGKGFYFKQS